MKRWVLDAALFVLLILLMGFQALPKPLHEAMGIIMPLLALLHLAWNRKWLSSLGKGRWNAYRALTAAVNLGLIVSLAVAAVSGLAIANRLFSGVFGVAWQRSILAHQAHITASYWLLIFSGLHLGLHWAGLWSRFIRWMGWDAASRRYRLGVRLAGGAIFALGVVGSFLHRIGDRLLMKHIFGTAASRLPPLAFLLILVAIFGMYAAVGYWTKKRIT